MDKERLKFSYAISTSIFLFLSGYFLGKTQLLASFVIGCVFLYFAYKFYEINKFVENNKEKQNESSN